MKRFFYRCVAAAGILNGMCNCTLGAAEAGGLIFATPEQAVQALSQAVNGTNREAFVVLFGPAAEALVNVDTVQGALELEEFAASLNRTNRLAPQGENLLTLEVGENGWPLPIPLVKVPGGWQFDTEAGIEELLNRRVGQNELDTLRVLRGYVDAQREYASRDRDDDEVLEFAKKFLSSPGKTDGLFWNPSVNGEISPLGPLVAFAHSEGYGSRSSKGIKAPRPFHGYLFRILTRQGKHAPGGKYDYVINGNMIAGFALVAWPAEYGQSGVMTFVVNQLGKVYQKDLGSKTSKAVRSLEAFDPDKTWRLSGD